MARCRRCFRKVGTLADEPSECKCGETELLNPEMEAEIDRNYKTIKVILELEGVKVVSQKK